MQPNYLETPSRTTWSTEDMREFTVDKVICYRHEVFAAKELSKLITWKSRIFYFQQKLTTVLSLSIFKRQLKTALFTRSSWLCCTCLTSAPSTMTRVAIFLVLYGVLAVTIDFMNEW